METISSQSQSAVARVSALLERIRQHDGKIHSFLNLDEADILSQAKAADERAASGKSLGPLDGVPVALKDVIAVKGQPLTAGSKILENFVSPYDAHVTQKLRDAGAILFGRLNMDEFAMGSSTENSAYGVTANPWDTARVSGGSSGGSAAAIAAGFSPLTLGSDTGGSIRQPAAFCGVVGLKPTYGLVSRYGLAAYASSLDQIGPMGETVDSVATLLQVIAGHDERDSTSYPAPVPNYRNEMEQMADRPFTLGVPKEYFSEGLDPEVRAAVETAISFYSKSGYAIKEVSLPLNELAVPVYYIIATAEASSNLARYDGVRYTRRSTNATDSIDLYSKTRGEFFGPEVKRRIILGTYVLSSGYYDAYYLRAQKVRTLIRNDFMRVLGECDAIICPTTPAPAFKIGEKTADPLSMYLADIYTISVNLAGLPGISIPCGFTKDNLPIGLQLIGKPFAESSLLTIAKRFEQAHDYHTRKPTLA